MKQIKFESIKDLLVMVKHFFLNFGKLKLRYYFGFMNLVFCSVIIAIFVSVWLDRPYDWLNFLTRLQTLIIYVPNAVLFPWIKVYQKNRAFRQGRKNSLSRNVLDYVYLARHFGNEAYNKAPLESDTEISKVPFSQYSWNGASYHAHTTVNKEKKQFARSVAILCYAFILPIFDLAVQWFVWSVSFVLGWFAMNRQLKEWRLAESNQPQDI